MPVTPVILSPQDGAVIRLDEPLVIQADNITLGGDLFDGIQIQIGTVSGFASGIVFNPGWRKPDGHAWGGDADEGYPIVEVDPSCLVATTTPTMTVQGGLAMEPSTTYYIRLRWSLDTPATSNWSAEVSVTTESRPAVSDWLATR